MNERRSIPFWVHQAVEYLAAALVGLAAVGLGRSAPLALLGALGVGGLAAVSDGPLGCCSWVSRRTHQLADFALVALLAVGPWMRHDRDPQLLIVAGLTAAGLGVLSRSTVYEKPPARRTAKPAPGRGAGLGDPGAIPALAPVARALGRVVGRRRRPPGVGSSPP